jgi:hypothetical protein
MNIKLKYILKNIGQVWFILIFLKYKKKSVTNIDNICDTFKI